MCTLQAPVTCEESQGSHTVFSVLVICLITHCIAEARLPGKLEVCLPDTVSCALQKLALIPVI